jgi:rhodanese-related sulfurtransferase
MIYKKLRTGLLQALGLVILGVVSGIVINTLRPDAIFWFGNPAAGHQSREITLEEARDLYKGGHVFFLDARDSWSYKEGHLPGAVHCPPDEIDRHLASIVPRLTDSTTFVTYCDGVECHLGAELAASLKKRGINDVRVLSNGWRLWLNAGYPVEKERP